MLELGLLLVFVTFGGVSFVCGLAVAPVPRKNEGETDQGLIHILIPVHNEEKKIGVTLESIEKEWKRNPFPIRITVGMDSCTDLTAKVVDSWFERLPLTGSSGTFGSKWSNLKNLVENADPSSHWVLLLDAGTNIEGGLFSKLREHMTDPDAAVLAPSYRMLGSSPIQHWFWQAERTLKTWENNLGGPISIHGAAVMYRRAVLQDVYYKLKDEGEFKNDDVILPLATRMFFPRMFVRYLPDVFVHDRASLEKLDFKTQMIRRKRMVLGNIQWARFAFKEEKSMNLRLWGVSLRRMFRPFWFDSILIMALGLVWHHPFIALILVLLPTILFFPAVVASLYAPYAFFKKKDQVNSTWR